MPSIMNDTAEDLLPVTHCVLIDGENGGHELFNNVHPFTTNRLIRSTDIQAFKKHKEETFMALNNPNHIQYHIYYDFSIEPIDQYFKILKLIYPSAIVLHTSQEASTLVALQCCEHIWIVYGYKNPFDSLLKSSERQCISKANIHAYSWIEKLSENSNRIEYLLNYKITTAVNCAPLQSCNVEQRLNVIRTNMKEVNEKVETKRTDYTDVYVSETNSYQKVKSSSASDNEDTSNKSIEIFVSEFIKEPHENVSHVNQPQIDHSKIHFVTNDQVETNMGTSTFETIKAKNTPIKCNINKCNRSFKTQAALSSHRQAKHPIAPLTAAENMTNVSSASLNNNRDRNVPDEVIKCVLAMKNDGSDKTAKSIDCHPTDDAQTGVISAKKAEKTSKQRKRKNRRQNKLTREHINLEWHNSRKPPEPETIVRGNYMNKCNIENCGKTFRKLKKLLKHCVTEHLVPLKCPFIVDCCNSEEKHLGLDQLKIHIESQHSESFQENPCSILKCPNKTKLKNCCDVLEHIISCHTGYLLDSNDTSISIGKEHLNVPIENWPSWSLDAPFVCTYENCKVPFEENRQLKVHQALKHAIRLKCPFGSICQTSERRFLGRYNLHKHIMEEHAAQFEAPTCCYPNCVSIKVKSLKNWMKALEHILEKHIESCVPIEESLTIQTKIAKKCYYDHCIQTFKTRGKFQNHLVNNHPYPLRCPFNSKCNEPVNGQQIHYTGSVELKTHINEVHVPQFSAPTCFDSTCQIAKKFKNWNSVMIHIFQHHWPEVK